MDWMKDRGKKEDGFRVPEGYFEVLPGRIMERVRQERTAVPLRRRFYRVAVAAAVALFLAGGTWFATREAFAPSPTEQGLQAYILNNEEVDEILLYDFLEQEEEITPDEKNGDEDALISYLLTEGVDENMITELY